MLAPVSPDFMFHQNISESYFGEKIVKKKKKNYFKYFLIADAEENNICV